MKNIKRKNNKNYYVYKVTHKETNQFYIGSRGCYCKPEDDINYLGSQYSWKISKEDKKKFLHKTIIKSGFETMDSAMEFEAKLIYENIDDPLNENYHIPNKFYHTTGLTPVYNKKMEILLVNVSDVDYDKFIPISKGKVSVKDKDGNTMSVSVNDPRYLSGELKFVCCDRIMTKDKNGNILSILKNDPRYLSGELEGIMKGNVTVKDKDGNTMSVNVNDPKYLSGELTSIHKDMIMVKDKDGNIFKVNKDDPKYISGELISSNKNRIPVKDIEGKRYSVYKDDPRYLSGELIPFNKGNISWNSKIIIKQKSYRAKDLCDHYNIKLKDLEDYLKKMEIKYERSKK